MNGLHPARVLVWNEHLGYSTVAIKPVCVATVIQAEGILCGDPVHRMLGDVGLCAHHWDQIAQWREQLTGDDRQEMAADRQSRELAWIQMEADHRLEVEKRRRDLSLIYYIRRPDGLIKIGTTWRLTHRMSALRREHGELQLLVTHSGRYETERELHDRFAELRVTGEWFTARKRLTDWIRKCRLNPLYETQPKAVVGMDVIGELVREGNKASRAAGRELRAFHEAEIERVIEAAVLRVRAQRAS